MNNNLKSIFEEIWSLNPINKKDCTKDDAFMCFEANLSFYSELNAQFLKDKYKQYTDALNYKNSLASEDKYKSKTLPLQSWLDNKGWEEDYTIQRQHNPLDQYFYGED